MIYKIAALLRDEIQGLNFVEVAAGLATPQTVRVPTTAPGEDESTMVDKLIPMAYNDLGIDCEEGELYKLVPDTGKKSIIWWEAGGVEPIREDTYYIYSRANLVCIAWWNIPLINQYLTDPSSLVANLIATIPERLTNIDFLSQIQVIYAGEEPPGSEVLGKYGFDEPENQFATFPYFVTALNYTVEFAFGKNCTEAITLSPSACPPRVGGEEVALATVSFVAAQAEVRLRFPSTSTITIDWGDNNTEEITGQGNSTWITKTSAYAVAGTYNIRLLGAIRNLNGLRISSQSHVGGDVAPWRIFTNLTYIGIGNSGFVGDVSAWSTFPNLETINVNGCAGLYGNVSGWSALVNLEVLNCEGTGLTGDITGWSALVNLTTLSLGGLMHGDITGWTNFDYLYQALLSFTLPRPNLYGDAAPFLENIALVTAFIYGTNVTYSTANISTILTQIQLAACPNFTAEMVDQVIIDTDAGGGINGSLGVDDNPCRTAASNAARAALDANGWTVNVEEPEGLNGGGIIPATTQSDWVCDVSGLAALWAIVGAGTPSIVTGNGFTGNAQRFVDLGAGTGGLEIALDWIGANALTIGNPYNLVFFYRKKIGSPNIICPSLTGSPVVVAADNEGNAAASIVLGPLNAIDTKLTLQFAGGGAPGDWFEIDLISFL